MGTDGGGINILDPTTGNITVLEHISGDNHSLPTNTILCLHSDSAGIYGREVNVKGLSTFVKYP
jgi:hypothetical protein